jgi:hypothetical protein
MPMDFLGDSELNQPMQSQNLPRDFLMEPEKENESLGTSLGMALPRIGTDLAKSAYSAFQQIPSYLEKAKTEIPGMFNVMHEHPMHALGQAAAGLPELGNQLLNMPKNTADYLSQRLHLLPENIAQKVPQQGDISQGINEIFGQPQYPGEALMRGGVRNAINLAGAGEIANVLNPVNLSAKSIAKDVLRTGEQNKKIYSGLYNNLWKEAESKGYGDMAHIKPQIDIDTIRKFSPKKSIKGIEDFISNPTVQTAHSAKSDLLRIQRDLGRQTTLRTAERQQLKAASDAIDNIQNSMFKNKQGLVDQNLLDKYNKIQQGYANEVIPYKNKAINKFKRNEISSKELVNSLSKGEFMAKRGQYHKAMGFRNALKNHPYLTGAGAGGLATLLYNEMFGNKDSH